MRYYAIQPEVAGGWGEGTKFTRVPGKPVIVHEFDYEFDDWFGDDILTSVRCYIVTERLAGDIVGAGLTGFVFDQVTISKSGQFEDWYPEGRELPKFLWMKVQGVPARDDFGLNELGLIISEKALLILQSGGQLLHADIAPFEDLASRS